MTMYRADHNQAEIVRQLRDCGCSVQVLSQVGNGFPDLLVGFRGVNYLIEVKDVGYDLSEKQIVWHALWQGQVAVVRSFDCAVIKHILDKESE